VLNNFHITLYLTHDIGSQLQTPKKTYFNKNFKHKKNFKLIDSLKKTKNHFECQNQVKNTKDEKGKKCPTEVYYSVLLETIFNQKTTNIS